MQDLVIETRTLTKKFTHRTVVDAVNLRVPATGVYGFLGPNGAGKTTTIRMLLGLSRPNAGEVLLFKTPLASNRLQLLGRVGALVETPSLYSHLTGRENLEVTRRLTGAANSLIDHALSIVKLTADAGRCVREYSLGMRQRLGLALALLNQPQLLILDEPTNGLDPAGIHEMRELLRQLPVEYGITIFLSSHLLSEVEQIASHIGIIHSGRLLFQGTLNELHSEHRDQLAIGINNPKGALQFLASNGWTVKEGNDGLLLIGDTSDEAAAQVNRLLLNNGYDIFHLARTKPSLEDIFLSLTGANNGEGSSL